MKVAVVSAGIVSNRRPHGEALIAHNILSRLARRGHDVIAYCTEHDGAIDGVEFRVISTKAPSPALGRLGFARRVARAIEPADVHHLLLPLTTHEGYTLATGAPLVVGPLMLPWPAARERAKPRSRVATAILGRYERSLHARTLKRAARLLVTGEPARDALPHDARENCDVVPYGVDTARFVPSPLPEDPSILFYSVLLPRKGIQTLLDALPLVRARVPKARLIVAGDNPLGLSVGAEGVDVLGSIDPADAPALFKQASVFCQPSFGEPFGMTILEAMASARPVVATHAGGVPGFVRDGVHGRLVPPGQPGLLADALIRMLESHVDAQRIGESNRRYAEQFDWERVVDGIEATYERVVRKEPSRVRLAS